MQEEVSKVSEQLVKDGGIYRTKTAVTEHAVDELLITEDRSRETCQEHDLPVQAYCWSPDCNSYLCLECILKNHRGQDHEVLSLKETK